MDPSEREDDEVCAELRLNQSLLKEQITTNIERRCTLIELVKPKMHEHEEVAASGLEW
jgi:Histone acetyltransferases subunit 3